MSRAGSSSVVAAGSSGSDGNSVGGVSGAKYEGESKDGNARGVEVTEAEISSLRRQMKAAIEVRAEILYLPLFFTSRTSCILCSTGHEVPLVWWLDFEGPCMTTHGIDELFQASHKRLRSYHDQRKRLLLEGKISGSGADVPFRMDSSVSRDFARNICRLRYNSIHPRKHPTKHPTPVSSACSVPHLLVNAQAKEAAQRSALEERLRSEDEVKKRRLVGINGERNSSL